MADNRKYYYLKLKEDFFDTDEMKILESMKDGYLYSNILLKLYLKSLSNSGKQAMNLVSHGLQYYSERVIDSISPYAKNDAGLIVLVLRHLANEIEKNNPGAKELAAGMEKCVGKPSLQEIEKIKKPNRR